MVGDTSDGAIGEDVTVVMFEFGRKLVIFDELVTLAIVGVTICTDVISISNHGINKMAFFYHSLMISSSLQRSLLV